MSDLTPRARSLMEWHERELTALLVGVGPGDVGYEDLLERVEGCRKVLEDPVGRARTDQPTDPTAGPPDAYRPTAPKIRGIPFAR